MMNQEYRDSAVEALILASPDPLPGRRIARLIDEITPSQVAKTVASLNSGYADNGSSFRIREIAGGYQIYIMAEYVGFVEDMFSTRRKLRLSKAALETLAVIAYRQPATKVEVEHIRGVASDGVVRTLLEKGLITVTGRADTVGKPLQYGTTDEFLKFFGLASMDDLPKMGEIEEMISTAEKENDDQLQLAVDAHNQELKLNIADGSFDPAKRNCEDLDDSETDHTATAEADITDEAPSGPAPEQQSVDVPANRLTTEIVDTPEDKPSDPSGDDSDSDVEVRKLVLKKTAEDTILSSETDNAEEELRVEVDSDAVGN